MLLNQKNLDAIILSGNSSFKYDGVGDYSYILLQHLVLNEKSIELYCGEGVDSPSVDHYFPIIPNWGISSLLKLTTILRQKKPKWVFLQYEPYSFSSLGTPFLLIPFLIYTRILGIKVHVNFHEISIRLISNGMFGFIRALIQRSIAYFISIASNRTHTSNLYYQSLLKPFKTDLVFVPSNFEFLIDKGFTPKIISDSLFLIVVNANRCEKILFEIISKLSSYSTQPIQVNIIGRASQNDLIRINHYIEVFGLKKVFTFSVNLESDKVIEELQKAHLYIQLEGVSSRNQGGICSKSGTIATAMLLGIPTISTCGDMTDLQIFKDGINIIFVNGDPNNIAKKINHINSDKVLKDSMRENAKRTYWKFFSWEHSIAYYLNLFN